MNKILLASFIFSLSFSSFAVDECIHEMVGSYKFSARGTNATFPGMEDCPSEIKLSLEDDKIKAVVLNGTEVLPDLSFKMAEGQLKSAHSFVKDGIELRNLTSFHLNPHIISSLNYSKLNYLPTKRDGTVYSGSVEIKFSLKNKSAQIKMMDSGHENGTRCFYKLD